MGTTSTIALVSGANRGIGLAIAAGLARRGVQVLLGSRDISQGEAAGRALLADGLLVRAVELDATSASSIARLAETITQDYGRLDVLVNNAGIALDYDQSTTAEDKIKRTLSVNVVGAMLVTEAMLPLLAASDRARIVNVSSELASFGQRVNPAWPHVDFDMPTYQASKAALNSLTLSYATRLKDTGIKINAICPGYTATQATNYAGSRTPDQAALVAIRYALLDDDGPTGSFSNDAGGLPW